VGLEVGAMEVVGTGFGSVFFLSSLEASCSFSGLTTERTLGTIISRYSFTGEGLPGDTFMKPNEDLTMELFRSGRKSDPREGQTGVKLPKIEGGIRSRETSDCFLVFL
jgi:hypothetical protein